MDIDEFREHSCRTWDAMAAGWESRDAFLERKMGVVSDFIINQVQPTPARSCSMSAPDPTSSATASPGESSRVDE